MQGRLAITGLAVAVIIVTAGSLEANPLKRAIPPSLEIIVLDPNADPMGNPAPEFVPGIDGQLKVDIPPTILIHRFYYTGNRSFQGPFIKGGPTTVVTNHPRTGERVYVPVQMPPGAPRVTYCRNSIEYDFGQQGVTITFPILLHKPTVSYRNHKRVKTYVINTANQVAESTKNLLDRSGVSLATQRIAQTSKNVFINAIDRTSDLAKAVTLPVVQMTQFIPGINLLTSPPEDQAQRLRDFQIQQAGSQLQPENVFIPTNR